MPDPIATPFSPQSEMDVGDDISQTHRERQQSLNNARTLDDLLNDFDRFAGSTHEKGDLFERLVKRILQTDPVYKQQFSQVWRWAEWPGRDGETDAGVDLVAQYAGSDEICAIQCKFYSPNSQVSYNAVAKFIVEADRIKATSRIFVSTTDNIAKNAQRAFDNPDKPVNLLGLAELQSRNISWPDIWNPENLDIQVDNYKPRPDQINARDKVIQGFNNHDRGKLILPCGTGKTYTALQIAETLVGTGGKVLYLVPSIALLGQTMREWAEQQSIPHRYLGICSDVKAGKRTAGNEDLNISALEIPVTTDAQKLAPHLHRHTPHALTVVFSTYQSIDQVINAQNTPSSTSFPHRRETTSAPFASAKGARASEASTRGMPGTAGDAHLPSPSLQRKGTRSEANAGDARGGEGAFDLVICDEAHRTTGIETQNGSGSHFTKVHNPNQLRAKKRLYMTATPRIYSESAKNKALEIGQVSLYSMDDETQYGPEFHRMTFHDAVEQQLLSDYKVVVLTIQHSYISEVLEKANENGINPLTQSDAAKLVGCWKALAAPEGPDAPSSVRPLQRAIAFTNTIKNSKAVKDSWPEIVKESQDVLSQEHLSRLHGLDVQHVDGTMNALARSRFLDWLRASEEDAPNECRILSNARCLSEGIDVPALDAVLFLHPRKSIVDVVQGVGRVMRRAPNKNFGYILLPVVIPPGADAVSELDNNKTYQVVWEVLQALRSHDERLDAYINQIDINRGEDSNGPIIICDIGKGGKETSIGVTDDLSMVFQSALPGFVIDAFHAKIVDKVGDRQYWDRWAKDVAIIATTLEQRIRTLIPKNGITNSATIAEVGLKFDSLLDSMRTATNDALNRDEAVSIVAEHMITEPVFQALFPDHDFAKSNPVARSLNEFVALLHQHGLQAELESLDKFYESVRRRATGLDNSDARRKVLEELYENFFKHARPKVAQRLGVVYTPHEIVDFILNSTDHLLQKEFGKSLSDKGVHILDPFAGMGTFIWRLLANPELIRDEDLERKFEKELHANEILPLAYYMASINVEETFRERIEARDNQDPGYLAFQGMVWRDTFNAMTKGENQQTSMQFMQENDIRAKRQDETNISVIIGNPPYSRGQTNANDDNQNVTYEWMQNRIRQSYVARSRSSSGSILHDHYALACRWATDRIPEAGGIIGIVSNGSFLDSNAGSGIRACFADEFTSIYAFNLRGNQRTQGETSRKEGGKIFGSGSRAPIAITLFVKNPANLNGRCTIYYRDIGDYLSREEKLDIIRSAASTKELDLWEAITPDQDDDWINQRDNSFNTHLAMGCKPRKGMVKESAIFSDYALGTATNRDFWVYDFSKYTLEDRMCSTIGVYQTALNVLKNDGQSSLSGITRPDPKRIKWNDSLRKLLNRKTAVEFEQQRIRQSAYRPFGKAWLYSDRVFVTAPNRQPDFYPDDDHTNLSICVPAVGDRRGHSAMMTDSITDLHVFDGTQCFPRYNYSPVETTTGGVRLYY